MFLFAEDFMLDMGSRKVERVAKVAILGNLDYDLMNY